MIKRLLILVLSVVTAGQLTAQIITDRPDQTESSSTVGSGSLQIESGLLVTYEGDEGSTERQLLAPTTLLRYGITDAVELRLLSQFESVRKGDISTDGISDIEIGTKIQLYKPESAATEVAFLSHVVLRSGTRELTGNSFGSINKVLISHQLSSTVGLDYNFGYSYFGTSNGDLTYSIALGIAVNDKVGVYIEPYGELRDLDQYISNFDAGFTYLANPNLQFDFSFGVGLNQRMNYLSVGVSSLLQSSKSTYQINE